MPNTIAANLAAVLLTVPDFAERLAIKESTVRAWILRRRICFIRVNGRAVRIPESEIERIISAGIVPALPDREVGR